MYILKLTVYTSQLKNIMQYIFVVKILTFQ